MEKVLSPTEGTLRTQLKLLLMPSSAELTFNRHSITTTPSFLENDIILPKYNDIQM